MSRIYWDMHFSIIAKCRRIFCEFARMRIRIQHLMNCTPMPVSASIKVTYISRTPFTESQMTPVHTQCTDDKKKNKNKSKNDKTQQKIQTIKRFFFFFARKGYAFGMRESIKRRIENAMLMFRKEPWKTHTEKRTKQQMECETHWRAFISEICFFFYFFFNKTQNRKEKKWTTNRLQLYVSIMPGEKIVLTATHHKNNAKVTASNTIFPDL